MDVETSAAFQQSRWNNSGGGWIERQTVEKARDCQVHETRDTRLETHTLTSDLELWRVEAAHTLYVTTTHDMADPTR